MGHQPESHPIHGDALRVKLRRGVLQLSGQVASDDERHSVIAEARRHVGRGVDDVDARRLRVARRDEQPGILEQRLIAAFPGREIAEYALTYVLEHSRVKPKEEAIVDFAQDEKVASLGEFARDVRRALVAGSAILILGVDETEAFEVRELLDEDTGSLWTMAMPPQLGGDSGR